MRLLGRLRIVRHHDDRLADFAVETLEQLQDLLGRRAIEVAGGLVGDDQRRIADQRAGDRDALLLAAGELVRVVLHAVGETDERERRLDALAPLAPRQRT